MTSKTPPAGPPPKKHNVMPKDKKEKIFIIFCVFCIACGAVLRFIHKVPLSFDEAFTIVTADSGYGLKYILKKFLVPDVHPPLFNIIMYFWNSVFPSLNEAAVRIPSLIFSFAALAAGWFYYPRGRDLAEKCIFAAFLSVSLIIVYYSAFVRSYSLVLLLSVLLTFKTLNMAGKISKGVTPSKKDFALYFILTLLAGYTHYVGAITAGAQTLVLLGYAFSKKRGFWRIAALYFLVVVLMAPWMYFQAKANLGNLSGAWWHTTDSTPFAVSLNNVLAAFTTGEIAGLLIWLSVLYALFLIVRRDQKALRGVFILFPFLTLIISSGVILLLLPKINFFIDRLFTPLLPSGFLVFAFFMNYAAKKRKIFMLVNAAALCAALLYTAHSRVFEGQKEKNPKAMVNFLLDKYPSTRGELFYAADYSPGNDGMLMIIRYYFRAAGALPERTYNIATPAGLEEIQKRSGVTPVWVFVCVINELTARHIIAQYGNACLMLIPHKTPPGR